MSRKRFETSASREALQRGRDNACKPSIDEKSINKGNNMKNINKELFDKVQGNWNDKYKLELAINKHIRELDNKLDYIDSVDLSTYYKEEKDRLKYSYQKEMADLFLLLAIFFEHSNEDYDDLLNIRLHRFLEKEGQSKGIAHQ